MQMYLQFRAMVDNKKWISTHLMYLRDLQLTISKQCNHCDLLTMVRDVDIIAINKMIAVNIMAKRIATKQSKIAAAIYCNFLYVQPSPIRTIPSASDLLSM